MTTEEQNKEIFSYLLGKELAIDLSIELFDHFKTQIYHLRKDGLSFDEAFEMVKKDWHKDLKLSNNWFYDYGKSKFKKRMWWARMLPIIKKSAMYGLIGVAFTFGAWLFFDLVEIMKITFISYVVFCVFYMVLNYSYLRKYNKLKKKYSYYKLTNYEDFFSLMVLLVQLPSSYNTFSRVLIENNVSIYWYTYYFLMIFFLGFAICYAVLSFRKNKESVQKIQPYLKYIRSNPFYS